MRPANSASAGLMPESITAIFTPAPVAPSFQALIAFDDTAPFDR
jgi:hypothetical protein